MDDSLTAHRAAVAVHVSQTQFVPGGRLSFPSVQSVMVLGCRDGTGRVVVNGTERRLNPEDLIILPWGHAIAYEADAHTPYLVFGLHLVPHHDLDRPVELAVAESPSDRLYGVSWRSPGEPAVVTDVVHTTVRARPRLAALLDYALTVFAAEARPAEARALGALACHELAQPPADPGISVDELPARVRRLVTWVLAHLSEPIAIAELVRLDASSPATITRLFRASLGASPGRWIAQQRIELAQRYLLTTTLTITQVARRVGFDDPYHFSRQFKIIAGRSPRAWRSRHRL